ncbi:MAG: hypothetical protein FJX80_10825 [Bacteroidetes bacterium]|nr:hypothetical protein [Bacteroidota bacterium]
MDNEANEKYVRSLNDEKLIDLINAPACYTPEMFEVARQEIEQKKPNFKALTRKIYLQYNKQIKL